MQEKVLTATDAAPPLGRYPHTRRIGPWVFVSGTSSRRPDNTYAGAEKVGDQWQLDIREQTRAVLENIRHYLQLNGGDLHNLVDVTVFLKNMADFAAYNEVYNSFFPNGGPCRTTVEVSALPGEPLLIEIKATAYIES